MLPYLVCIDAERNDRLSAMLHLQKIPDTVALGQEQQLRVGRMSRHERNKLLRQSRDIIHSQGIAKLTKIQNSQGVGNALPVKLHYVLKHPVIVHEVR